MCACHALGHLTDQENHKHVKNLKRFLFLFVFVKMQTHRNLRLYFSHVLKYLQYVNW